MHFTAGREVEGSDRLSSLTRCPLTAAFINDKARHKGPKAAFKKVKKGKGSNDCTAAIGPGGRPNGKGSSYAPTPGSSPRRVHEVAFDTAFKGVQALNKHPPRLHAAHSTKVTHTHRYNAKDALGI